MSQSAASLVREHMRLAILEALSVAGAYRLHEYLLLERVRALGLGTTRDALRGELAWLAEQGLMTQDAIEGAIIATLTDRGLDVAQGLAVVPGVARPRP